MEWYGIRSLFLFGQKSDGTNVFEERVVCFRGATLEEAHRKGTEEAQRYALDNGFELYAEQIGYQQDGEGLIDGYEVWSVMYEAQLSLEDFYNEKYAQYRYDPE